MRINFSLHWTTFRLGL